MMNQLNPAIKSQVLFNARGEKTGTIDHHYKSGLLQMRILNDTAGIRKVEYTYDGQGRVIQIKFFEQDKSQMKLVKKHVLSYSARDSSRAGIQG